MAKITVKRCQFCRQLRRMSSKNSKYCSSVCYGQARRRDRVNAGERHYQWKGDAVSPTVARGRTNRWYKAEVCEQCGSTKKVQRHHRDHNVWNNTPENIRFLCSPCHHAQHRALTPAQEAEVVRRYLEGRRPGKKYSTVSQASLAKEFGVSHPTISNILKRNNVKRSRGG